MVVGSLKEYEDIAITLLLEQDAKMDHNANRIEPTGTTETTSRWEEEGMAHSDAGVEKRAEKRKKKDALLLRRVEVTEPSCPQNLETLRTQPDPTPQAQLQP